MLENVAGDVTGNTLQDGLSARRATHRLERQRTEYICPQHGTLTRDDPGRPRPPLVPSQPLHSFWPQASLSKLPCFLRHKWSLQTLGATSAALTTETEPRHARWCKWRGVLTMTRSPVIQILLWPKSASYLSRSARPAANYIPRKFQLGAASWCHDFQACTSVCRYKFSKSKET